MEALLANYCPSDDEEENETSFQNEEDHTEPHICSKTPPSSSPPPSLFPLTFHQTNNTSSYPPPHKQNNRQSSNGDIRSSPLFSSLPQPKQSNPSPILPSRNPSYGPVIEEEEHEDLKRSREVHNPILSVNSFLSSMPAPKNSTNLGHLHSLGSGRRSVVEIDFKSHEVDADGVVNPSDDLVDVSTSTPFVCDGTYESRGDDVGDHAMLGSASGNLLDCLSTGSNRTDCSSVVEGFDVVGLVPMVGKRVRNEVPVDIIEVNQEDLMKNRPREDQNKLNGIAFGPSYQGAASTKGKPTKLHKRKHQIGSLYHDMRQKEIELSERRARGFLTKSETQAKYGW